MVKINGIPTELSSDVTAAAWLTEHSYRLDRIAVELNGSILPKDNYDAAVLKDGDVLEIVSFVGGG